MFGPSLPPAEEEEKPKPVGLPWKLTSTLKGHKGAVYVARFNQEGDYCLTGGQDRSISLWNPHKGTRIKEYKGEHGYEVLDVRANTDNSKFASCGGDRVALFWDVATGRLLRKARGHEGKLNCLQFNEDCSVLVTGSYDMTIKCWDLRSNMRCAIQTLSAFKDSVTSLEVTATAILGCSMDGTVRVFDIRKGQVVTNHIHHGATSLSLSADRNCILTACLDSKVRLFDRHTGEQLNSYRGHTHKDYTIGACFSNTDGHVLCGSEDKIIRIWNLVDGDVVHELHGHTGAVSSLSYHPKAGTAALLSASFDGTVRFWTDGD